MGLTRLKPPTLSISYALKGELLLKLILYSLWVITMVASRFLHPDTQRLHILQPSRVGHNTWCIPIKLDSKQAIPMRLVLSLILSLQVHTLSKASSCCLIQLQPHTSFGETQTLMKFILPFKMVRHGISRYWPPKRMEVNSVQSWRKMIALC